MTYNALKIILSIKAHRKFRPSIVQWGMSLSGERESNGV